MTPDALRAAPPPPRTPSKDPGEIPLSPREATEFEIWCFKRNLAGVSRSEMARALGFDLISVSHWVRMGGIKHQEIMTSQTRAVLSRIKNGDIAGPKVAASEEASGALK